MSLFGNQIEGRNKAPLGGGNPGGGARGKGEQPEPIKRDRECASQASLTRIMELHEAGHSAEEIAVRVLTANLRMSCSAPR
jgi:hypothetical protein